MNATPAFRRTVCAGTYNDHSGKDRKTFVFISWDGSRLSITGVEGPKANGDAYGSCGQCLDALDRLDVVADGLDVAKLKEVWQLWHLNDMRPYCEHQADWPTDRKVEIVSYGLTSEACRARSNARDKAARAAAKGEVAALDETEKALVDNDHWWKITTTPPDADSPLCGCYEVKKRETKALGWVTRDEHPEGLLSKPCPVCGYKYGSRWLREEVPEDVLAWLFALPDNSRSCPTCWLCTA